MSDDIKLKPGMANLPLFDLPDISDLCHLKVWANERAERLARDFTDEAVMAKETAALIDDLYEMKCRMVSRSLRRSFPSSEITTLPIEEIAQLSHELAKKGIVADHIVCRMEDGNE
mgnify:CR=1 FL=1